jgi:hypothetical protein
VLRFFKVFLAQRLRARLQPLLPGQQRPSPRRRRKRDCKLRRRGADGSQVAQQERFFVFGLGRAAGRC